MEAVLTQGCSPPVAVSGRRNQPPATARRLLKLGHLTALADWAVEEKLIKLQATSRWGSLFGESELII